MEVVKNKFQPNLSYEQKWDLLHELIIAAFFHKAENIKFMDDSSQSHCEFIEHEKEYEVKFINLSNVEKCRLEQVTKNKGWLSIGTPSISSDQKVIEAATKKSIEHIEKANNQIKNPEGLIYLIISMEGFSNSNRHFKLSSTERFDAVLKNINKLNSINPVKVLPGDFFRG